MYNLVSRITDGLGELKKLLETHIHNQGLAAIEKCGEAALNVRNPVGLLSRLVCVLIQTQTKPLWASSTNETNKSSQH